MIRSLATALALTTAVFFCGVFAEQHRAQRAQHDAFFLLNGAEYAPIDRGDFWDRLRHHNCLSARAYLYAEQPPVVEFHCEG